MQKKGGTPIIVFAYNRVKELQLTLESLFKCEGVEDHDIIIFRDGPKTDKDLLKTNAVKSYLLDLQKERTIKVYFSDTNQGLANSVIRGVSKAICDFEKVIVLEDDLLLSSNFLLFMEQALDFYQRDKNVFSVSGYSPKINFDSNYLKDFYFVPRASSWGWATWQDRWESVDWNVNTYSSFKNNFFAQWRFAKGGIDLPGMLLDQMNGKINSWAIRWVYQQFLNGQATVYPSVSKVKSIGFGEDATHTKKTKRFDTTLDIGKQVNFDFEQFDEYDPYVLKEFRSVFSIWKRILDRF